MPPWLERGRGEGQAPFRGSAYAVFRNVKEFGALGDGVTDDTDAIQAAISSGERCGSEADSSTKSPALVYFPGTSLFLTGAGTYRVSKPILVYYFTHLSGDPLERPVLRPLPHFEGIPDGTNWYTPQNNFFRSVAHFVIDLTAMPFDRGTGMEYVLVPHQIFMENASGGFMSDLSFHGGRYGAWLGNQQFTERNVRFSQCHTAICQHWNWAWTFMDVQITDCEVGLQMLATLPNKQGVGSLVLSDWDVKRTNTVVQLEKEGPGRLVLDNMYVQDVQTIVAGPSRTWLAPASNDDHVAFWVKTPAVVPACKTTLPRISIPEGPVLAGACAAPPRPACLVDDRGFWFGQEKPWFARLCSDNIVSLRSLGAQGDGVTDDTQAMQAVLDQHRGSLVYGMCARLTTVPYGLYLLTDTLRIPVGTRMVGEAQPVFLGTGPAFQDTKHPRPVVQVGVPGDVGDVTLCDLIFSTRGPTAGAIVLEWNVHERTQGSVAMFDVHIRLGGFAGTELELAQCPRDAPCEALPHACFLGMHITPQASGYFQNVWVWTADHELDEGAPAQLNVLSDRGILIESQGPVWMYGTASEHALLYQYSLQGASHVLLAMIQTESPYFQGHRFTHASASAPTHAQYPDAPCARPYANATDLPYEPDPAMEDRAVGLHLRACKDILVWGAGLYSFFDSYDQTALPAHACQRRLCVIEDCAQCERITLLNTATVGTQCMISLGDRDCVGESAFREGFCSTMALFTLHRDGAAHWL